MSEIQKFRKKPIVIEAVQWTGDNTSEVCRFGTEAIGTPLELRKVRPNAFFHKLCVETLEGYLDASPGDWIIKGVKGEFYPCKPDIFAATYEPADSGRDPEKLDALVAVLKGYEQWETDLIMSNEAWGGGQASLPTPTQELWDRFIELQTMRNDALAAFEGNTPPEVSE